MRQPRARAAASTGRASEGSTTAVVPVALIERMRRELTFATIITAYGLTETCGTATMCRPGDDAGTVANTCGTAVPGVAVRVVDAKGMALPDVKELLVTLGFDPVGSTPEQFTRQIGNELDKWATVIRAAHMKAQ